MKYNRKVRGTPDAMQVIFIGDSYGTGYGITPATSNWIDYCANILGSSGGYKKFEYKKAASNGAGFAVDSAENTFLALLQSITTVGDEKNLDVTDIVVCGGWNDGNKSLTSAMQAFKNYCVQNYPYAKIHIGYVAWERAAKTSGAKVTRAQGLTNYIREATSMGMIYMSNIEYVLHDYALLQSDGFHPNANGCYRIAAQVANHLMGGQIDCIDGYREFTPTFASGVNPDKQDGGYFTWRHNNMSGLWFNATAWTFDTGVNFSSHPADDSNGVGWKHLFDIPDGQLIEGNNANGSALYCAPAAYTIGSTVTTAMTWIELWNHDGVTGVFISPYVVGGYATETGSGYRPLQGVTHVMFNVSTIEMDLQSLYC